MLPTRQRSGCHRILCVELNKGHEVQIGENPSDSNPSDGLGKNHLDVAENLQNKEWKEVMGRKSRKGKAKMEASFKGRESVNNVEKLRKSTSKELHKGGLTLKQAHVQADEGLQFAGVQVFNKNPKQKITSLLKNFVKSEPRVVLKASTPNNPIKGGRIMRKGSPKIDRDRFGLLIKPRFKRARVSSPLNNHFPLKLVDQGP